MRRHHFSPRSPRLLETKSTRPRVSSYTNYRQLSKRPRSSTVHQQYQKMIQTMYIMTNIQRAVKQNDLRFLIGQKRSKLRAQPTNTLDLQKTAHEALIDARKKYDQIKKQTQKKFKDNQKLKDQIHSHLKQQSSWKKLIINSKFKCKNQATFITDINQQLETKYMDKSILQHVVKRLKQDIQYYKKKIIIVKRNLTLYLFNLKTIKSQSHTLHTETGNANSLLQRLKLNLHQQSSQRLSHLTNLQQLISQKQLKQKTQQKRFQFQQQQAQKTILAKSQQQNNWNALLHTHLFIKKILENKMIKEMNKFAVTQHSFTQIKFATDVKDADTLITRFLNRQAIYGQLLSQVTKTKQKHTSLQTQFTTLTTQNQQLLSDHQRLSNLQYSTQTATSTLPLKTHESLQLHTRQIKNMQIVINQWLSNQLLKISSTDKKYQPLKQQVVNLKGSTLQFFKIYLQHLNDLLNTTLLDSIDDLSPLPKFVKYSCNTPRKLQLKNIKRSSLHHQNSYGLPSDIQQTQQSTYKIQQQNTSIIHQRQQLHKMNLKFMKDVRLKLLQCRKIDKDKLSCYQKNPMTARF